jgi:hypothetical protein
MSWINYKLKELNVLKSSAKVRNWAIARRVKWLKG